MAPAIAGICDFDCAFGAKSIGGIPDGGPGGPPGSPPGRPDIPVGGPPRGPPGMPPGRPLGKPPGMPPGIPPPGALVMLAPMGMVMEGMLLIFGISGIASSLGSGIIPGGPMPGAGTKLSVGGGNSPGGGALVSGSIGAFAFAMSSPRNWKGGTPALASGMGTSGGIALVAFIAGPPAGPESDSNAGIAAFASMPSFGILNPARAPNPGATPVPGSDKPPGSVMPAGSVGLMPDNRDPRPPGAMPPATPGDVLGMESESERPCNPPPGRVPGPVPPSPGNLGSAGRAGSLAAALPPTSF
mmetsp:Transcript_123436/g.360456  ORF Transcript_123436/g.360456 Transcript_123436/m.360456 type:complete len:299 (+) Transcript_123436:233-1129(+)